MRRASVLVSLLAVVLVGLVAVSRIAGDTVAQEATPAAGGGHPIIGTWRVFLEGLPGVHGLLTHAADGTMVSSDPITSPDPSGGGVVFLSAAHGVWEATGPDTAAYTFQQLVADANGHLAVVVTVRGERQVSADGQTFTSAYAYSVADPAGAVLDAGGGTVRGERMTVEPMDMMGTPTAATPAS
ncbi:MAG: hypothetical protein M3Q03_02690 [Chloroflexota bacterium]|nr:hypothetical protein [Chloroflexota bacterium]